MLNKFEAKTQKKARSLKKLKFRLDVVLKLYLSKDKNKFQTNCATIVNLKLIYLGLHNFSNCGNDVDYNSRVLCNTKNVTIITS